MAPPSQPLATLADAQVWLGTLHAGDAVALGSADFAPAVAKQVFALLPGGDPLSLGGLAADAEAGTLSGTATVMGDAGCTATFAFTATADDPLLLGLTVALPPATVWHPLPKFDFGFGDLVAKFLPEGSIAAVNLEFDCAIQMEGAANLPISLSIPSVPDADWVLASTGTVPLTGALLPALSGGVDPLAIIGNGFTLDNFTLSGFEMAFNGAKATVTMVRIGLAYDPTVPWKVFGEAFEITGFAFEVEGFAPFSAADFQASATAKMELGGIPIDVTAHFPDAAVLAYIDTSVTPLRIEQVFAAFNVSPPAGFPDIQFSTLSFGIYESEGAVDFTLAIDTPFPIFGGVNLDQFHFALGIVHDSASSTFSGHGDLLAAFSVGSGENAPTITLEGDYDSGGDLSLTGEATNIAIGDLLISLAGDFDVHPDRVPQPIRDLTLKSVSLSVTRTAGADTKDSFCFALEADTQIAGAAVAFMPVVTVGYDETLKTWSADFKGTLNIKTQGGDTLVFTVEYSDTPADNFISASYAGTDELGFDTIAEIFDFSLPPVPPSLKLDLVAITFRYDFTSGDLMFGTASANPHYGKVSFVSKAGSGGDEAAAAAAGRQHVFVLAANEGINLADLPLVGKALSSITTVSLDQLEAAIVDPAPLAAAAVGPLNAAIALGGPLYPLVPTQGLPGPIQLSARFTLGGDAPTPFSVSLGGSNATPAATPAAATPGTALALTAQDATPDDGVHWFQVQKSFGPVSIQKVGVRYDAGTLWALINADLNVGPVDIGLIGLGAGSPLDSFSPKFTVSGVTVSLAAGPVSFSGALVGEIDPPNLYGELGLGMANFSLGALAAYADDGYPSFFLYAVLDAELGGPPFFFVTGVAAGFGFNRNLVVPDVGALDSFPLIQWATGGGPSSTPTGDIGTQVTDAMTTLADSGVIAPALGEYWFAAGIKFTSFELIDSFALLIIEAGSHVEIDLLGLSTLTLPPQVPGSPDNPPPLAVAQLALEASFNPGEGVIKVAGQLTSRSYVLSKDCHLTGGFAFYMWYKDDPLGAKAGEFLLSLGGYSPNYTKPAYYPDVPRLGLNWQLGGNLSITGDEYFALTPSAIMAGGGLSAVWSSGPISAWFSVEADFLLLFTPLHYHAELSIDLGASVKIDLLFTSFTISVHIGVDATIWGPPFAVEVDVDLDIVSFSITFGDSSGPPDFLKWSDFVATVLPQGKAADAQSLSMRRSARLASPAALAEDPPPAPPPPVLQIAAKSGILKSLPPVPGAPVPLDWLVDGQTLVLIVSTTIPLNEDLTVESQGAVQLELDPADTTPPTNKAVGVGPTNTPAPTGQTAAAAPTDPSTPPAFSSALSLTAKSSEDSIILVDRILSAVPKAVWEQRDRDGNGVPQIADPLNDTVLPNVLTGAQLTPKAPCPQRSLAVPIQWLQYTTDSDKPPLAWSQPVLLDSDTFNDETVHGTIAAAAPNRAQLIAAINRAGFAVDAQPEVGALADAGSGALLAPPALRYLVEAR